MSASAFFTLKCHFSNYSANSLLYGQVLEQIRYKEVIRDAILKCCNDGIYVYYMETTAPVASQKKMLTDIEVKSIREVNAGELAVSIIPLPIDWCRIVYRKNNSYVVAFNLEYFRTYIHLILSGILAILFVISLVKYNSNIRCKILIVVVAVIAYLSAFLPAMLSTSTNVRAMLAVSGLYFILTALVYATEPGRIIKILSIVTLAAALFCNIIKIEECEINLKRTNVADRAYAEAIIEYIEQYETDNGCVIDEVSFCQDSDCAKEYYEYSFTNRAFTITWSSDQILNVYKDVDHPAFLVSEMPEEYEKLFAGRNWDRINLYEQIVFDNNHAYICIY